MNQTTAAAAPRHVRIVHDAVPGRARLKVGVLYRAQSVARRIESALRELPGVERAEVNPLTAGVVVRFEPGLDLARIVERLEATLAELPPRDVGRGHSMRLGEGVRTGLHRGQRLWGGLRGSLAAVRQDDASAPASSPPAAPASSGTSWHALDPDEALAQLDSSRQGLSEGEAQDRLTRFGANRLPQAKGRSDISMLLEQFASPPVALLGASVVVSVATGGIVDAVAILGVVGINAGIGFFTERQSERTIRSLAPASAGPVHVIRDGETGEVAREAVVTGDIVLLRPGTYVPADARMLRTEHLSVDESALTGESLPVSKAAQTVLGQDAPLGDRENMVYMGTAVTGGQGLGLVVETGLNTEIGHIQAMAEGARHPETPVERQLDQLGGQLAFVSAGVCAGVFVIGLLRGYGLLPMLKASISLAVAAVPEGLPTVATTTLALGIRDMRRRNVLIRRLDAVETLGSTQIICLDKTGTLTLNRMSVVQIYAGTQRVQVEDGAFFVAGRASEPQASPELRRLLEVLALCNETRIDGEGDDLELSGTPTEQALVRIAMDAGIDVAELRAGRPRLETRERSDEKQYMVTVHPTHEDRRLVAVKGNPNQLLDLCGRYQVGQELRELDPDTRSAILRENERMAGDALRVLGAAYVEHGPDEGGAATDLTWLGLVGMADPVRPGMDTLLDGFHRAGIETAMITGDQSATAYAIAKQLDLAGGQSLEMLDSTALERLEPNVLAALLREVRVFSRVSPAHKLQIVQALQKTGKIVAMTGDGVNDGPALKAADLGIAMGGGGSDVARSLSDVVITDDNLHTLQEAVRHGRTIYNNIRKSIRFLLSTNMSEIELTTVGVAMGLGEPMNPMQLLWINIMTDVFPALALAMEPPEPEILERPPRSPDEPVIRGRDLRRLGAESGVITAGSLGAYGYALWRYGPGPQASTHAFMSLTLAQLLHAMSSRSEQPCVLTSHGLPRNRYLDVAVGTSVGVQLLSVALPPLRRLLGTTRIGLVDALVIGASAALPLLINEATKQTDARQAHVSTGEPVPRGVSHDQ